MRARAVARAGMCTDASTDMQAYGLPCLSAFVLLAPWCPAETISPNTPEPFVFVELLWVFSLFYFGPLAGRCCSRCSRCSGYRSNPNRTRDVSAQDFRPSHCHAYTHVHGAWYDSGMSTYLCEHVST